MRQRKPKHAIHVKFLTTIVLSIVITVCVCLLSIILFLKPFLNGIFERDTQTAVQSSGSQLSYYLDEINTYAKDISFQPIVQNVYNSSHKKNSYAYFKLVFDMENYLDQYTILHDNLICDILLLNHTGDPIEVTQKYGGLLYSDVYQPFLASDSTNGFTVPHQISMNRDQEKFNVIAYVCNINSSSLPDTYLGKLILFLKYDALVRPLQEFEDSCSLFLFNERSLPLYPAETPVLLSDLLYQDAVFPYKGRLSHSKDSYLFQKQLSGSGWTLIGVTPSSDVYAGVLDIIRILCLIMLLCAGIAILLSYTVTNQLVRPLNQLIDAMKRVSKGERHVSVEVRSHDEIADLSHVFNRMMQDLDHYTEELRQRDKKEYEMTIQMLMYQINPHFIYNTLNCIICLARKKNFSAIIELTKVFIVLLQRTLKTMPDTMSSIQQEMEYTDNYVSVLQYSYETVSPVIWEVDAAFYQFQIPHLILYPIVENSVFHGILTENRECHVTVQIQQKGEALQISVSDNGRGMDANTLSHLRSLLQEENQQKEHIGLMNVNNRLKLLYGREAQLEIQSQKGQGCTVSFCIPLCKFSQKT